MNIPESHRKLLPQVRDIMLKGGLPEAHFNLLVQGILVGAAWANHPLDPVDADELAKDILAAMESFKPSPRLPNLRPSN